jgi:hypothetical protein
MVHRHPRTKAHATWSQAITQYSADKQPEPVLIDWHLPKGSLYFVVPTARARPAKVSALADFFISKFSAAKWERRDAYGLEVI